MIPTRSSVLLRRPPPSVPALPLSTSLHTGLHTSLVWAARSCLECAAHSLPICRLSLGVTPGRRAQKGRTSAGLFIHRGEETEGETKRYNPRPQFSRQRKRPQKARKKRSGEEPKWVQVSSTSWRHCLPRAKGAEQPASSAWVVWGTRMRRRAKF